MQPNDFTTLPFFGPGDQSSLDPEGSNYSADLYFQAMYQLARS
jgi:hypothetical protein